MNKIKNFISMLLILVALIGTIVCKVRMEQIDIERHGIIHSFQEDYQRDQAYKKYELWFSAFAASFIFTLLYLIGKYVIGHKLNTHLAIEPSEQTEKHEVIEQKEQSKETEINENTEISFQSEELQSTLSLTSEGASNKFTVKEISQKFDDCFKSHFVKDKWLPSSNYTRLDLLKDQIKKGLWTKTDLCRIALLIFHAKILSDAHNEVSPWIMYFFEMMGLKEYAPHYLGMKDIGFKDNKQSQRIHDLFNHILVEIGCEKNPNFMDDIRASKSQDIPQPQESIIFPVKPQ